MLLWAARKQGYKVATILSRGAAGLPFTSPKLNCAASWRDIEAAFDYFYEKYGLDPKTKEKRTRIYAYGVSLGALLLYLYLGRAGEKTSKILDGASIFSNVWNTSRSNPRFLARTYGLYNWLLGINLNNLIRKNQLPLMEKVMDKDAYEDLANALETNRSGLDHLERRVYAKMYGFKNRHEYYNDVSADRYTKQITVPVFALHSKDDPICEYDFIPFKDIEAEDSKVMVSLTNSGAHACHVTGSILPRLWYQKPCLEFINFLEQKYAPKHEGK